MFKSLFGGSRKGRENPALEAGRLLIQKNWMENHQAIKDFPRKFVQEHAELWMDDVAKVASSSNPLVMNREALAICVLELAEVQVLVIDPPPAPDRSGLRGQPGITGELKHRVLDLSGPMRACESTLSNWG